MDDSRTAIIGGAGRRWSVSQAADLLSVTTKTIYRHIQDGTVGSVRVGVIAHPGVTTPPWALDHLAGK